MMLRRMIRARIVRRAAKSDEGSEDESDAKDKVVEEDSDANEDAADEEK